MNVHHERYAVNMPISRCFVNIDLETKDFDHIDIIKEKLEKVGFNIVKIK